MADPYLEIRTHALLIRRGSRPRVVIFCIFHNMPPAENDNAK